MKRFLVSNTPKSHLFSKGATLAVASAMTLVLLSQASGDIIGDYYLQGNFDNSATASGSLGSLTSEGSTVGTELTANGWTWANTTNPGAGLHLQVGSVYTAYSLAIVFQFSDVETPGKVVSFGSLDSDLGLYVLEGTLSLLAGASGNAVGDPVYANTTATVIITRATNGMATIYLNGIESISIEDKFSNLTIQDQLNFVIDDTFTEGLEFSPSGNVSRIVVWNTALTEPEVMQAFEAIPEPSVTALIGGLGLVGFAYNRARRKKSD